MILLMKANCQEGVDIDFAWIELTTEVAQTYLALMDEAAELKKKHGGFYALELYDCICWSEQWYEEMEEVVPEGGDCVLQPELPKLRPEDHDHTKMKEARVDCETVHISRDDLYWTCHAKNTAYTAETSLVSRDLIEKAAKGEA